MIMHRDPEDVQVVERETGSGGPARTTGRARPVGGGNEPVTDPEHPELGASTAEYGIVMLAAVGFAGLLVAILKSGEVKDLLLGVIRTALSTG
ncbi:MULTISPECIES: DUF4244 domain-containing protein [Micrococcales]|uniref:DUF4244 domain-containing protein n=1 Tax=Micrococcales TaxID=85006 RepID=UPI00055ACA06|nr:MULTISPECIES: DUF4244 domain-containing protein [Micrococcales]